MADRYILRVTAGPGYDEKNHVLVPVNVAKPVKIAGPLATIDLSVRVRDYNGLPRGSPSSSKYFETEPHAYNQDQYSICFSFTPHAPKDSQSGGEKDGIKGTDLQFGNDFDRPIRDKLPPGFSTAMNIVKWWIDPGLDGDAYADRPHLYGPALSSLNALHIGAPETAEDKGGIFVEEGGGEDVRTKMGMPDDSKGRMKWGLNDANKESWLWKYEETYGMDFYNPYIDFSTFSLRLPGFHLPILKYWDGQGLRYVLRNRLTGEVYLAVCFTIHLKEDVDEEGNIKEEAKEQDRKDDESRQEKGAAPSSQVKNTAEDDLD
ncbi:uncharacterized protein J7T54_004069 [Emericellopsis cladophorae]|uniref:Domain of unknown function at the cortex 1 domain-containing protein n=1 Tax=Emericellopsis cladophorae TaxID=2686198 RepID=A0A9Q0BDY4_9HYPO|nr:uncharacterized protein J7T54_004069 [Emericellopsis cladophorae]KAI6781296.1 hypothetical protein J7T54_004069 [Emericellopsis cladophorae]